jgi:hypothetical protein
MIPRKQKPLPLERPSDLPKFQATDGKSEFSDLAMMKEKKRQLLKDMLKTEGSVSSSKLDPLKKLEESIETLRRSHEQEMFKLDQSAVMSFTLPGRPDASTLIPRKKAKSRKIKVNEISHEAPVAGNSTIKAKEFAFLPVAIGLVSRDESNLGTTTKSSIVDGGSNRNLSDLDEIANIMDGIKTGSDAINFFARFGSDTPVSYS